MAAAVATRTSFHPNEKDSAIVNDMLVEYLEKTDRFRRNLALPAASADVQSSAQRQGEVSDPLALINSPADWTSAGLKGKEDTYTLQFSEADTAELIKAVDKIKARGVASEEDVKKLTKDDYELPTLTPKVLAVGKEVSLGRGFHLIKGFPVAHYKGDRLGLVLAFWGLGLVLGTPQVSQTDFDQHGAVFGSLLNHVTVGRSTHGQRTRGQQLTDEDRSKQHRNNVAQLAFHSDQAATDLIALLSVTNSPEGGHSKWVSGIAIRNELLRRGRKDLVEVLSDPKAWQTPRKANQSTFERNADGSFAGYESTPPFELHDGWLSLHFRTNNYSEVKLTPLQEEACWTFASLAEDPDFHFSQRLVPGEILIIHNMTALHSRSTVHDGETNEEKRHLLRWWIAQPKERNPRPDAPSFAPRSLTSPGGGFRVPAGTNVRLPFFPYTRHDGEGQSDW